MTNNEPTAPSAALVTYEDCINAITKHEASASLDDMHHLLRGLKAFFQTRAGKKSKRDSDDGSGAVKRLMESRYQRANPVPATTAPAPDGLPLHKPL